MGLGAEGWVIVALFVFFLIVMYLKVPATIAESLDQRAVGIRDELDQARRLKEESQELLAEYQRKHSGADSEAEEIIAQAKREAEVYAEETRAALDETLKRRTKLAEEKIARAEEQAAADVKSAAVGVAIAAAESLIRDKVDSAKAGSLIDTGISELKAKLN